MCTELGSFLQNKIKLISFRQALRNSNVNGKFCFFLQPFFFSNMDHMLVNGHYCTNRCPPIWMITDDLILGLEPHDSCNMVGIITLDQNLIIIPFFLRNKITLQATHLYFLIFRSEEHTSELQSRGHLVCRLLL